ncbi:MAG: heme ABC exporter ATP-binding protein CcmA [Acidobacteria bacterium]|nr:heme ABC exporter ATP-binding protein CcmA [Acidobacteriota bacterium]
MQVQTVTDFKYDLPSASPAIQARGLTKLFGDFPALQNVSFDVERGEYLALLGHNGAGKTTLLKLLALLSRPSFGQLKIAGQDPADDPIPLRSRIGLLGHNTFLYDELTAEENLHFYGSLYGIDALHQTCHDTLESVGLTPFATELVRNFSRGMRQRLTIGRLFLHQPDLLLLDEPFSGLDERAVTLLESLLAQAHARGTTIVLCTHQLELALKHAKKLMILHRGKVAHWGAIDPARQSETREMYRRFVG